MAQWLRHPPTERGIPGSNPGVIERNSFFFFVLLTQFELDVPISSSTRIVHRTRINGAKLDWLADTVLAVRHLALRIRPVSLVGWIREYYDDSMERSIGTTLFHLERRREDHLDRSIVEDAHLHPFRCK